MLILILTPLEELVLGKDISNKVPNSQSLEITKDLISVKTIAKISLKDFRYNMQISKKMKISNKLL